LVKKAILTLVLAIVVVLGFTTGPALAGGGAADLSKQCQEALKKTPNEESKKLCGEGDKLLKEGKQEEATAKFNAGLEKLGMKKGS
jgi:outer membrane protein assembly factor BamD (BamD/ComL family)